jgi:hypothetical protein
MEIPATTIRSPRALYAYPESKACETNHVAPSPLNSIEGSFFGGSKVAAAIAAISKNNLFACWILAGLALRLAQYLYNRSLWRDESLLTLNILHRTARQLWQPLDYSQGAPLGFLMLQRLAVNLFGHSEFALRLIPLVCGLLSLFLFYRVAMRFLTPLAASIAMALFAISDPLIYYSSEAKQYSTDVAVALLLILTSQELFEPSPRWNRVLLASAAGMIALWFSHASVFVLGGLGLGCFWNLLRRKGWSAFSVLLVPFLAWVASFALLYFVSLRHLTSNSFLLGYWQSQGGFAPFPPTNLGQLQWYLNTPFNILAFPGGMELPGLAALAWALGCIALWRKNRALLLVLVVPALLTLLASALQKYPFQGRLLLFLTPLMLLAVGEGAGAMVRATKQTMPLFGVAFIALLFLYPGFEAAYHLAVPRQRQEIRPLISELKRQYREGDALYVDGPTLCMFSYYAEREHLDNVKPVPGAYDFQMGSVISVIDEVNEFRAANRVWFLFSGSSDGVNQEDLFFDYLNHVGKRLESFQSKGASLYLYDLGQKSHKFRAELRH